MKIRELEEIQFALAYKKIMSSTDIYSLDFGRVKQLNDRLIKQLNDENEAMKKRRR